MTEALDRLPLAILRHLNQAFTKGSDSVSKMDFVSIEGLNDVRLYFAVYDALRENDRVLSLTARRTQESAGQIVEKLFKREFRRRLKERFPWLGTEIDTNGGDVVDDLNTLYGELKGTDETDSND